MQIKSIVAGAAIALAATIGSASAGDEFSTLGGVSAESLSSVEMAAVVGAHLFIQINPRSGRFRRIEVQQPETHGPLAGLARAQTASGGVVTASGTGVDCPPNCGGGF